MIYEFIAGIPYNYFILGFRSNTLFDFNRPFNDDSVDRIFENIKSGKIEWPDVGYEEDEMTPEA